MSERPMVSLHLWTSHQEEGRRCEALISSRRAYLDADTAEVVTELLRVVAERDEARQALLKIRSRAARSIARSGPRTTERRLAKDIQKCALDALRDAGLLPEEDGAPTGRQEDRERP